LSQTTITATENLKAFYALLEVSIDKPLLVLVEISVALALVYFANKQWRTGQENIRQQLFEKRLDVFDFTTRLQKTAHNGPNRYSDLEAINSLHIVRQRARFLFGNEISYWFQSLHCAISEEMDHLENEPCCPESEWNEFVAEKTRLREARTELFEQREALFSPYLNFSNSRK
jgi:hypothetical protein